DRREPTVPPKLIRRRYHSGPGPATLDGLDGSHAGRPDPAAVRPGAPRAMARRPTPGGRSGGRPGGDPAAHRRAYHHGPLQRDLPRPPRWLGLDPAPAAARAARADGARHGARGTPAARARRDGRPDRKSTRLNS